MATREENLKKLSKNLEAMSDDELEQVTGGTYNMTAADTRALNEMGFDIEERSALWAFSYSNFYKAARDVNQIFCQYGIYVDVSHDGENAYYQGKKSITRKKAFDIICQETGKPFPSKFNY